MIMNLCNLKERSLARAPVIALLLPVLIYIFLHTLVPDLHAHHLEGRDVHAHLILLPLQRRTQVHPDPVKHDFHCPACHNLTMMRLEHEEENAAGKWNVHGAHREYVEEGKEHGDCCEGQDEKRVVQCCSFDALQNRHD